MPKLKRKYLLFLILLLSAAILLAGLSFFQKKAPEDKPSTEPRMALYQVKLVGRTSGKVTWEIDGPKVEISADQQTTYFRENPSGFFAGNGGNRFSWKSAAATYTSFNKTLALEGNVEGSADNGDTFFTTRALWENNLLQCPDPVQILSGGMRISAGKMDADASLDQFTLMGNVKGYDSVEDLTLSSTQLIYRKSTRKAEFISPLQIKGENYTMEAPSGSYDLGQKRIFLTQPRLTQKDSEGKKKIEIAIASDRLEGDQKKKEFLFSGKVQAQRQGTYLTQIEAEKMVYHQGTGNFELSEAVNIRQKDKKIKGNAAAFVKAKQELTVTGNVLIQNEKGEWLRAEKAILNTETNQLVGSGRVKGKILVEE